MRPIQSGDRAVIIRGALGTEGPNIGKEVRVGLFQGDHSEHGRIWRVHGAGLITEFGAVGDEVDCAQSWLQRIDPLVAGTETQAGITEKV